MKFICTEYTVCTCTALHSRQGWCFEANLHIRHKISRTTIGWTMRKSTDCRSWRLIRRTSLLMLDASFRLQVIFPDRYPLESPEVIFLPEAPIHPHIYSNGHICLDILYVRKATGIHIINSSVVHHLPKVTMKTSTYATHHSSIGYAS